MPVRMKASLFVPAILLTLFLSPFSTCFAQLGPSSAPSGQQELGLIEYGRLRLLSLLLSADGTRLLLNLDELRTQRSVVRIHETSSGRLLFEREVVGPGQVRGSALSRDGSRAILSVMPPKVLPNEYQVVDVGTGEVVWTGSSGPGDATFLDAAGDKVLICHISADSRPGTRELFTINVKDRKELSRFSAGATPGRLQVSANNELMLASLDKDGPPAMCVLDLSRRTVLPALQESTPKRLSDRFAFLGNRNEVVGVVDNVLIRWNPQTGAIIDRRRELTQLGRDGQTAFSPDGRCLYLLDGGRLHVVDTLAGTVVRQSVLPPNAEIFGASDNGAVALNMNRVASVRIIKLRLAD